jgi:hypothetical protein
MGSHNKSRMELTTQQNGWLRMADMKNTLFDELQRAELQVQSSLEEITTENLKSAKSIMASAKEKRMAFTGMITDKLINPSMELEMRKKQEEETLQAQALINEEAALRNHITNEYFRIAAENRLNYQKAIDASYRNCLRDRIAVDKIPAMVQDMKHILSMFELPEMAKFQRTYVSDERAMEIYQSIEKYDPKMDLMRYQSEAEKKWLNYEMDLANAEVAIKALEKQAAEREAEIAQEIAIETATNTLIAQAETITLETPRIKREVKIIVVESEAWAKAVLVNFIRIFPVDKLRVKSWSKLTLAQMAEALAKSGAELHNLQTEEVCK